MQLTNSRFISVLATIAVARLFGMATLPLIDTSEPRYAEIARIMAVSGDWITPWFEPGTPFWGKPPLAFWTQAVGIKLFGLNEFSVRFPSFVAMVVLVGLLYRVASAIEGEKVARWTTLIMSSMLLPLASAGAVLTDPFLAVGVTWSMLAFIVTPIEPRAFWRYGFFVGLAIGMLAKGPIAIVLAGLVIVPWIAFQHNWRAYLGMFPWSRGLVLFAALSLPWYILAEIKTPGFLRYFLVGEHFLRFVDAGWRGDLYGTAHDRPLGSIWLDWLLASAPWGPIAVVMLLWSMRTVDYRHRIAQVLKEPITRYLVIWSLATPTFFTLSGNILWTYVLPSLPALAWLLALAASHKWFDIDSRWIRWGITFACGLVPVASVALGAVSLVVPHRLKTERELIAAATPRLNAGERLYFVGSRPFSARFYSHGEAQLLAPQELCTLIASGQLVMVAVKRDKRYPDLEDAVVRLRTLFESRRYILYEVLPALTRSPQECPHARGESSADVRM